MATHTEPTKNAAKPKATVASVTSVRERVTLAEKRAARAEAKVERLREVVASNNAVSNQVRGFVEFLRKQSVVGLAIGLVLGTQAKMLVDQLIASFFNPLIGLLLPGEGTLKEKVFTVTINGKGQEFAWGAFVLSLVTFIVVAAVVYFVFKGLRLDKLDKKKDA